LKYCFPRLPSKRAVMIRLLPCCTYRADPLVIKDAISTAGAI